MINKRITKGAKKALKKIIAVKTLLGENADVLVNCITNEPSVYVGTTMAISNRDIRKLNKLLNNNLFIVPQGNKLYIPIR